uniref:Fatty acid amide hydrolase n=1 Tax=Nothobranchius rachovii TaxID=451742 RepID=A0A1A8SJI2_9TELE
MEEFLQTVSVDKRTANLLTTAACGLGALLVLVRSVSSRRAAKEKIERARTRRTESLHRAEQAVLRYRQSHPSTDSALILSLSLSELTKRLQEDSLSPEEVFYSYMEKTLNVHKKLNCCTEILLESLDELKTIGSKKKGLLYGIPISIKDNIAYKDHDCTCGVVINLEQPAQGDSVIVKVLKKQGAIPFVKTNLPQALLSYDCSNPIYGQTLNPCNPQKTSGGSSALYNLLNFPAGVVPVSTVTADDEEELKHYKGVFQDKMDKLLKKAVTGAEGLPVAVQCVALPWQDEVCLRFMKEVEHLVKQKRK